MTTETHPEKDPLATDTDSMHFALNAAGIGIWDMDPVRQLVKWDNRCRELYGFPEEEILSYTDVVHYIHPEDREQVAHAVSLALDPALRQTYETRFRTIGVKDGKLRWLLCKGKAYFDGQGVAYRFSGTAQDITELVLTLEKANTAEQLTHLAIDSTEAGSFFVDLDTNAIRYSPRLAWIFTGSEQTSLSREDLIRHIHPDDHQKRKNAYLEAERTGKVFFDARAVWQDGTVRYIRSSGAYIYDLAGRAIAFSGIVHDITAAEEGKAEEQKLSAEVAASEQRFRTMIEHSPIAICLFSGRDLVIEMPNEAMIQLIGKGRDISGKKLADVMPELQGQPYLQILDDVFTTRKAFHTDASRVHIVRDGKVTDNYYSFSYTPLVNAEGAVYAILEMAMDVTGNILAQQQITETETKLRNAIDSAWLGTWEINLETGDIVLSERARGWLGYTPEETITFEDMLSSIDDSGIIADVFRDTAAGKRGGSLNVEYRIINRQSGRLVYLRVLGQAFYRQSGEAYLMSGIMQDITLQKNTEKELERQVQERTEELALTIEELSTSNEDLYLAKTNLEQSNYELEQYAYVASHDLQEPLRKIRVFSEILNERNDIPGDAKITLSKVIHSSERMSLLIKDLLQFSTLLHGEKNTAEVDLGKLIRSVISDFELLITEKGAQIELEDLPVIEAIPLQMNQLFYNLLSNALKFSRKDTPPLIRIRAEKAAASDLEDLNYTDHNNTYFRITFTDNGIGFSQEYAEQVFEVFKRLQTKSVYQGTGIGLSVCRRIAQQHYGTIYALSEEDKGTQFVIILPVVQPGK